MRPRPISPEASVRFHGKRNRCSQAMALRGIVTLRGSERHLFSRSENSHAAAAASHQVFMAEARSVRCVRAEVRWR